MSKYLLKLGKRRKYLANGKYTDVNSWWERTYSTFSEHGAFNNFAQFKKNAEQDLFATIIEYKKDVFGIKSLEWTGGSISEDIDFVAKGTDGSFIPIKAITGLSPDNAPITRNAYRLSGMTVMATIHLGVDCNKKNGIILMANGHFHESLFTDWAPGKNESVRFLDDKEILPVLADVGFWDFYRKRIQDYQPPANEIEIPVLDIWQNEAVTATVSPEKSGGVYIGTGGGKTLIFAFAIAWLMGIRLKENSGLSSIYTIVVPTLLLARQTLEVVAFCIQHLYGKQCKYLVINSADENNADIEAIVAESECGDIPNTTNKSKVKEAIRNAVKKNIPLVTVVTYMSQKVLYEAITEENEHIEMVVFDEAHNLVKGRLCGKPRTGQKEISDLEYAEKLESISSRVRYFTATPPKSYDGRKGFHLDEKYKALYSITDGELILKGFITLIQPVYINVGKIIKKNQNGDSNLLDPYAQAKIAKEVFGIVTELIFKDSKSPYIMAPRLLIRSPNSTHLDVFQKSPERGEMSEEGISTYTISCLHGLYKNENKYTKSDFRHEYLKEQMELPLSEPSITGYVQMLGEGINVQSFNAILPFEPILDSITRIQTFGRGRRTNRPEDFETIKHFNPTTFEEYMNLIEGRKLIKPFCYVCTLMWGEGSENYARELKRLTKRDYSEMMGAINNPILVDVNVPDELPAGPPGPGKFVANIQTPPDRSNIAPRGIELNFTVDKIQLTADDMYSIRAEIKKEERKKEEQYILDERLRVDRERAKKLIDEIIASVK